MTQADKQAGMRHRTSFGGLVLLIFAIHFLRAADVLLYPPLQVEDGDIFAFFYQHRNLAAILRYKGGYLPLIPNLIGYVSMYFPLTWVPYILSWTPLALTLAAQSLFFSKRYRPLIKADWVRFLTCVAIAVNPFGQFHLVAHTDYSIWNCLLLFILLSLPGFPQRFTMVYFLLYNLLIWGHPLTLLALPFVIYWYRHDPQTNHKPLYIVCLLHLLLHQLIGGRGAELAQFRQAFHALALPTDASAWHFGHWPLFAALLGQSLLICLSNVVYTLHYSLCYVGLRTLVGASGFAWLATHHLLPVLSILFGIIGLIIVSRRSFRFRPPPPILVLAAGYIIFSVSYLSLCVRGMLLLQLTPEAHLFAPRYAYIQAIFFLILVFTWLSGQGHTPARCKNSVFSSGQHNNNAGICKIAVVVVIFAGFNLAPFNLAPYQPSAAQNGRLVQAFVKRLAALETRTGNRENIRLRVDKLNDWPIIIDTTK
jgi:hypothetical protein